MNARSNDAFAFEAPPFDLPATFAGRSCSAVVVATLKANGTVTERITTSGRELFSGFPSTWSYDAKKKRLLFGKRDPQGSTFYASVDRDTLQRLDRFGGPPDSECSERLHRLPDVYELPGAPRAYLLDSERWSVERIGKYTIESAEPSASLRFDSSSKTIEGSTDCGSFTASYAIDGSHLSFSNLSFGHSTCTSEAALLEWEMRDALERTTSFHLCCMTLRLREDGRDLVTFRPNR